MSFANCSFGMILWEMLMQQSLHHFLLEQEQQPNTKVSHPFQAETLTIDGFPYVPLSDSTLTVEFLQLQIMEKVKVECYRPWIPEQCRTICPEYVSLIERCWSQDPSRRPSFHEISQILLELKPFFFTPHSLQSLVRTATSHPNYWTQRYAFCAIGEMDPTKVFGPSEIGHFVLAFLFIVFTLRADSNRNDIVGDAATNCMKRVFATVIRAKTAVDSSLLQAVLSDEATPMQLQEFASNYQTKEFQTFVQHLLASPAIPDAPTSQGDQKPLQSHPWSFNPRSPSLYGRVCNPP